MSNNSKELTRNLKKWFEENVCEKSVFLISYLIAVFMGLTGLSMLAINYLMKDVLNFSPAKASLTNSISFIPWMVKPIFGLATDSCPIYGYKRRPYLFLTSAIFIISYVSVFLYYKTVWIFLFSIFSGSVCLAFCSVIGEALIVESSNQKGHDEASENVSNFYIVKNIGTLISSLVSGYLLEVVEPRDIFLISSGLPLIILVASFFLKEKRIIKGNFEGSSEDKLASDGAVTDVNKKNDKVEIDNEINDAVGKENIKVKFIENKPSIKINTEPSFSIDKKQESFNNIDGFEKVNTVTNSNIKSKEVSEIELHESNLNKSLNNSKNTRPLSIRGKHAGDVFFQIDIENNTVKENYLKPEEIKEKEIKNEKEEEISCGRMLRMIYEFIAQKHIYKPILFILFFCAMPSYDDALFYFYTNELKFKKEMMGRLTFLGTLTSIIGIYLYKRFFYKYSFKAIIVVSTLIYLLFNLLTLALVLRLNTKIGIPDYFFSVTANSITNALAEINTMPLLVITANMCPKNIEGTTYALLMSIINLGYFISYQFGGLLNYIFNVSSTDFKNLWMVILSANLLALIQLPMIYCVEVDSKHDSNHSKENTNKRELEREVNKEIESEKK
jgi:folate/biopterin transporter